MAPFALTPGPDAARTLLSGMDVMQLAWPFTRLTVGDLDEFIEPLGRMAGRVLCGRVEPAVFHAGDNNHPQLAHLTNVRTSSIRRRRIQVALPSGRETNGVRATKREKDEIRAYVESQAHEDVVHLERAASELVGSVRHDIWDAHCAESRWWVVTNPTNLYDQADFKSRDVVLTFHIGLMLRVGYAQEREVPVAPGATVVLPGSWRRWQQAFEAYDSGDEAETFQSVGVRLRECLVSFVGETRGDDMVPEGQTPPKAADFKGWTELLANALAPGDSAARLRSYLKKLAVETWEYVNWLTHAKNAVRMDSEIGLKQVEYLLGMFTAARLRLAHTPTRCEACESYAVVAGVCQHCEWADPLYEVPALREWSDEERAQRLAKPCTLTSDISTFVSPDDFRRPSDEPLVGDVPLQP